MSHALKALLEVPFRQLDLFREDPSLWQQLAYQPYEDAAAEEVLDRREGERYHFLIALFYRFRATDEDLLIYLLEQEITMHEGFRIQAVLPSLIVSLVLLARLKDPRHIPLFIRAKRINFDAFAGAVGEEFLLSAGLQRSYDWLPHLPPSDRAFFRERFGDTPAESPYTDEHVAQYLQFRGELPPDVERLTTEEEISLASELGAQDILEERIAAWIGEQGDWTKESLLQLAYYERLRGNTAGVITARERLIPYTAPQMLRYDYDELCRLWLKAGDPLKAWHYSGLSLADYARQEQYMIWGSARGYLEQWMEIILLLGNPEHPVSRQALAQSKPYLEWEPWEWGTQLADRIIAAMDLMGEQQLKALYIRKRAEWDQRGRSPE